MRYEDISLLLDIEPDYLGFRGALCAENDRVKSIEAKKITQIRKAVTQQKVTNRGNVQYKCEALNNDTMA